eukprot:12611848-Alexandrium_andersonii.AAC.1
MRSRRWTTGVALPAAAGRHCKQPPRGAPRRQLVQSSCWLLALRNQPGHGIAAATAVIRPVGRWHC